MRVHSSPKSSTWSYTSDKPSSGSTPMAYRAGSTLSFIYCSTIVWSASTRACNISCELTSLPLLPYLVSCPMIAPEMSNEILSRHSFMSPLYTSPVAGTPLVAHSNCSVSSMINQAAAPISVIIFSARARAWRSRVFVFITRGGMPYISHNSDQQLCAKRLNKICGIA